MRATVVRSLLTLAVLACASRAGAQSDIEANAAVQFNFSIPGARSLAMGGAFIASADDATAAYSNPAGLLRLTEPEASVEVRRWQYEVPFAARGRASGTPTGLGVDVISGVGQGIAKSELEGLSFASVVFPSEKWVAAVSYNQLANFETRFVTEGIFAEAGDHDVRLRPTISTYDLDVRQLALSWGREWRNGVALGFSLAANELRLDSLTQRFSNPTYLAFDPSRDFPINFQTQQADAQALGFTVGLRWDSSERWSTGMVYRANPRFDIAYVASTFSPSVPIPPRSETLTEATIDLPDTAGLGIAFHPTQRWTVSFDYQWVLYSQLNEGFVVFFPTVQDEFVAIEDFKLEDAAEVHFGFEYVFDQLRAPIALRGGAWYDPDHRLRAETGPILNQAVFFKGEDTVHATAGIGLVFGSHFQLDAALDVSDLADTASVSALVRF